MLEPPSPQLVRRLQAWRLCTAGGLRRCRRRVKRLACDLPAFDSVWIDALVQARLLTSYQARVLESDRPDDLALGPYVILDRLGSGPASETFVGRPIDGNQRAVLKRIRTLPEETQGIAAALADLAALGRSHACRACVLPHASTTVGTDVIVVGRFIPGTHLGDLLIRRGRFPIPLVNEIGRQVLEGLVALERLELVHGNLRLNNIRITSSGQLVLVDSAIAPIVSAALIPDAACPPDAYDGVAPELIGTGNPPSMSGDLYALGCLLWQLLAGRPPFPTGDSLAKLAAHQTRAVPDVREWVPDTPEPLARKIAQLVERDPNRRPESATAAAEEWGWSRRAARRKLTDFQARVSDTAEMDTSRESARRAMPALLALLFVVSGMAMTIAQRGSGTPLLRFGQPVREAVQQQISRWFGTGDEARTTAAEEPLAETPTTMPLPAPDADGVLQLTAGATYDVSDVSMVGPLVVRGDSERPPTILVRREPLRLWAEQLIVENVHFREEPAAGTGQAPAALLLVQSQELVLSQCRFSRTQADARAQPDGTETEPQEQGTSRYAVGWRPIDAQDRAGTSLVFSDVRFECGRPAVFLHRVPETTQVRMCSARGGPFLTVAQPPVPGRRAELRVQDTRLVECGSIVHISGKQASAIGELDVRVERVRMQSRLPGSVIEWEAEAVPPQWNEAVRLVVVEGRSNGAVESAVLLNPSGNTERPLAAGPQWRGQFLPAPPGEWDEMAGRGEKSLNETARRLVE